MKRGHADEYGRVSEQRRVDAAHADFKAQMAELEALEQAKADARVARAAKFTIDSNGRLLLAEYAAAGVARPEGLNISLSLLLSIGWTVEEVEGKRTLVRPASAPSPVKRKTRNEHSEESLKEGF